MSPTLRPLLCPPAADSARLSTRCGPARPAAPRGQGECLETRQSGRQPKLSGRAHGRRRKNLGRASGAREPNGGTARLTEAVTVYRAALDEMTRERVPLEWAQTQTGWAVRFTSSASGRVEQRNLRKPAPPIARRCRMTRERVPLDWAATQNNLGNAWALGDRTGFLRICEICDGAKGEAVHRPCACYVLGDEDQALDTERTLLSNRGPSLEWPDTLMPTQACARLRAAPRAGPRR